MNTQKPTLPPPPRQPLTSSPEDTADTNLHDDLDILDRLLAGPAPDGEPCPHCGGPDCPGGDDDPCVIAWRGWMEEEKWTQEVERIEEEGCERADNDDTTPEPTKDGA